MKFIAKTIYDGNFSMENDTSFLSGRFKVDNIELLKNLFNKQYTIKLDEIL